VDIPIKNFFMHQCPQTSKFPWEWGHDVFNIVEEQLLDSGLLQKDFSFHDEFSYERIGNKMKSLPDMLTCFDDLYLSPRNGIWLTKSSNTIAFRAKTFEIYGEPKGMIDTSNGNVLELQRDSTKLEWRPLYCANYAGHSKMPKRKTKARIKIFQRTQTENTRSFINLQEVIDLAQLYTTVPVEVVTVNKTSSIKEQIRLFNSFDVLISPHGSHLANGIFTMKPNQKAIIEVVSFAFDRVFYSNYNAHLGLGGYYMSTGHLTPLQNHTRGTHCRFFSKFDFDRIHCKTITHKYPLQNNIEQTILECPANYDTRPCDTLVDIDILRRNLNDIFDKNLCRDGLKIQNADKYNT